MIKIISHFGHYFKNTLLDVRVRNNTIQYRYTLCTVIITNNVMEKKGK